MLTLTEYQSLVVTRISQMIDVYIEQLDTLNPYLFSHMQYFKKLSTTDGKRIRGYLIYVGANCYSSIESKTILDLSVAIELFHTAILIHDDIMDRSEKRRGIASFHTYEDELYHDKHIAQSIAIAIADAGFFMAQQAIVTTKFTPLTKTSILKEFNTAALQLAYGQIYDMINTVETDLTFDQLLDIFNLKTGSYTFTLPLHMGFIAASQDKRKKNLDAYAYHSGLVFQLTDDLLDIYAGEDSTGKSGFADVANGKITSVIRLLIDKADEKDTIYLCKALKKPKTLDTENLLTLLHKYSIKQAMEELIHEHTTQALASLNKSSIHPEPKGILQQITLSLTNRKK